MKILGIDYGMKKIGLAISDENHTLAFPKEIVRNDSNTFSRISEIIKTDKIQEIVVGESVDFKGKPNALSTRIEIFISMLRKEFKLPIHKQKEFLTSMEARRSLINKGKLNSSQAHSKIKQIKSGHMDAKAAAIILQRYLDKIN